MCQQLLAKLFHTKFHENTFSISQVVTRDKTDGQAWRRSQADFYKFLLQIHKELEGRIKPF